MHVPLFIRVLPVYLLIASFLVVPLWQRHQAYAKTESISSQAEVKLKAPESALTETLDGTPDRIVIPKLGINLAVVSGHYDSTHTKWSVAPGTANYAVETTKINNRADKTFIYGHWTDAIFGRTKNLKAGYEVLVYTNNGHIFKYVYTDKKVIPPTYNKLFDDLKGKPGLAIMTCQGLFAQERRVMFFDLVQTS